MGPGENAGAVSAGDGWAVAFKVESHNHPSAVEPFQGAATGVGGILRDVFALGARPVAVLDSLRFGELESERSRYLFDRVVAGIGHYGNSIGVPTVGGEVYFEPPYEHNCLVNAMCVGLARSDRTVRSAARDATGSGARPFSPRRSWPMGTTSGPRSRSVIRSRSRSCSSAASSSPTAAFSSPSRTSARRASRRRLARWPRPGAWGSTSTSRGYRSARPTWSPSRSWSPSPRRGCSPW